MEKAGGKKDFSQSCLANRQVAFFLIYLVLSLSLIDTPLNTMNEIFIGRKVQNWFAQDLRFILEAKGRGRLASLCSPPSLPSFLIQERN